MVSAAAYLPRGQSCARQPSEIPKATAEPSLFLSSFQPQPPTPCTATPTPLQPLTVALGMKVSLAIFFAYYNPLDESTAALKCLLDSRIRISVGQQSIFHWTSTRINTYF